MTEDDNNRTAEKRNEAKTTTSKIRRNRRRGKKNKPTSGGDSSPPSEPPHGGGTPKVDSGFSSGDACFESLGLSISGRIEQIDFSPKTTGYLKLVDTCYAELVSLKPEAATRLSLAEWRHIHALMLYGRIANCEFDATGFKQPAPTRISLPYDLRVFQPIFASLANLGVVEDKDLFVKYIPHCLVPSDDLESAEDVEQILDCVQYPWAVSWEECKKARDERVPDEGFAVSYSVESRDKVTPEEYADLKALYVQYISDLNLLRRHFQLVTKKEDKLSESERKQLVDIVASLDVVKFDPSTRTFSYDGEEIEMDLDALKDMVFKALTKSKELKFKRIRPDLTEMTSGTITWKYEDSTVSRDPGAYGRRLGWDPKLWKDYSDFVDVVKSLALFSLSFPKETTGTYAWLLPRREDQTGFFVNLPKPMPTPVWAGALLLDASTLSTRRVSTWYGETDRIQHPDSIRVQYVKKAIQPGLAAEIFR